MFLVLQVHFIFAISKKFCFVFPTLDNYKHSRKQSGFRIFSLSTEMPIYVTFFFLKRQNLD